MPVRLLASIAILFVVVLSACGQPPVMAEPVRLRASGSSAMCPLMVRLADAYDELSPSFSLEAECLGTRLGLEALQTGRADVALASWMPDEYDPSWRAAVLAWDGLAVIVHPGNPVDGVGLRQLRELFAGHIHQWSAVHPSGVGGDVQPVSRDEGSGAQAAFQAMVMDGQAVTSLAVVAPTDKAAADYVADNLGAIGYVSMGQDTSSVKILAVEGVLPNPQTIRSGSYTLSQALWLVHREPISKDLESFIEFALGSAGQEVVGAYYETPR